MKAWEIIEQNGWCQRSAAKDSRGLNVDLRSEEAVCFCAVGAILRKHDKNSAAATDIGKVATKVATPLQMSKTGFSFNDAVADWNDAPGRTKEEVVALLKELAV